VSKRFVVISALIVLVSVAWSGESSAQVRRGIVVPARRVVVVPTYISPYGYYDPFFDPWFYDAQWGYPGYGPYRHYNIEPEASVRLEVKPKQAEVYVDGYYAGIVDDFNGTFQRLHLPPGEHEIQLYLDGYRTVHQKVYLTPDNTFKVKYDMEKLPAGEQAEPRPQPTSPPPQAGAPGPGQQPPYAGPGRGPSTRRAPQPPPQPPPQYDPRAAQASAYGTLAIRVQPGDADVLVDGERWSGPQGNERLLIEVPEGRHTIEIRKSGYRSYMTDVDVRRGEPTPLNVSLRSEHEQ
jgi:hypothetical protein